MPTVPRGVALFPADRYALAQPRGTVTGRVVEEMGRAIVFAEAWRPGFTEVWDLTLSPTVDVTPSDVARLMVLEDETADRLRGSLTIVVTPRTGLLYAVRFYAQLMKARGREVVGVRTQDEAAARLGIGALPTLE